VTDFCLSPQTFERIVRQTELMDRMIARHDLARGDVQAGMGDYCLNTPAIDALIVESHAPQSGWTPRRD
jgi:hypothetical protein